MPDKIQLIRESQRGHFDLGEYAKSFGVGALAGLPFGEFLGGGLANMAFKGVEDLRYLTFEKNKKIAWLAGDLEDTISKEIAPYVKGQNQEISKELASYATSYKAYIDHYIRDNKQDTLQNNKIVDDLNAAKSPQTNTPDPTMQPPVQAQPVPTTGSVFNQNSRTAFLGNLLLGTGAYMAAEKGADYLGVTLRGDKQLDYAIEKANKILDEIDKVSQGMDPQLVGIIRSGGNVIHQLLSAIKQMSTQKQPLGMWK